MTRVHGGVELLAGENDSVAEAAHLRHGSRRLVVERRAGVEAADHMLSGAKERPKRKNFQPEATGQQASDFIASHTAKHVSARPTGGVIYPPSLPAGSLFAKMLPERSSSCTLSSFPSEASEAGVHAVIHAPPSSGIRESSKDLRSHLHHCEQLLERVEAEVHERERQLAGLCTGVSTRGIDVEAPAILEMHKTTSELSELRAELHERDVQLRGLQEEIGRAFNASFSDTLDEGNSPLPVLPPPERSSLASVAKVSLTASGDVSQKPLVHSELPAPSPASGELSVGSAERTACLKHLAALISASKPKSLDSHHIAPMSARLPGSRQASLGRLNVQGVWEDLNRILYDVETAASSQPAMASSAPVKHESSRRKRFGPSLVEAAKHSTSSSQIFPAKEEHARLNETPPKPRGSYIHAGAQVYWLNYEEPMDLQRLPSSGSVDAPSRPTWEVGSSRRAASAGCSGRMLRVTGCADDRHSREELAESDSEWSEEEPPSPSPEEPLLPETPMLATQRPTRPEAVPRLLSLDDRGKLRLGRASSAVWQLPPVPREEYGLTPRLVCHAPPGQATLRRSCSVAGTAGVTSCSSLRAPSTATTPRRQTSLGSLVRRHLSAPRLTSCGKGGHSASHECITPRSVSPGPKASGHHLGTAHAQQPLVPKLQQLSKAAPSVQLRAEEPLSGRNAISGAQAHLSYVPSQRCVASNRTMPMFLPSASPRYPPVAPTSTTNLPTDRRLPIAEAGKISPRPPCIQSLSGPSRAAATMAAQAQTVNWGILQ